MIFEQGESKESAGTIRVHQETHQGEGGKLKVRLATITCIVVLPPSQKVTCVAVLPPFTQAYEGCHCVVDHPQGSFLMPWAFLGGPQGSISVFGHLCGVLRGPWRPWGVSRRSWAETGDFVRRKQAMWTLILGTSNSCWAVHEASLGALDHLWGGLGGHGGPLGDVRGLPERV